MSDGRSDVLIVGSGPAGAAAGIRLARAGIDVCAVDRERFPRPKTCGDALSNRAVQIVQDLDTAGAFANTPSSPVLGATVIFPDGNKVSRRFSERPGYIVPRSDLDDLLKKALIKAGARLVQGVEVRDLTSDNRGINGATGDGWSWLAKLVIACDGAGSAAWRILKVRQPRGRNLAVAATAYVSDLPPGPLPGFSEHYFEEEIPCGYGWIFPEVNGLSNVGVYQRGDMYKTKGVPLKEVLNRFIARRGERTAQGRMVGEARSSSIPFGNLTMRRAAPGLMACGDAGCFADPLSGEGIWHALQTGALAADIAARALAERGRLDEHWARQYQRLAMLQVGWPSALRRGAQDIMRWLIDHRLYRSRSVRQILRLCYERGLLDVSKETASSNRA